MKLSTILASLGLAAPTAVVAPPPPSAVRNTARILLVSCETAIRSGEWTVDGACDPDGAVRSLDAALMGLDEQAIATASARLASTALDAVAGGCWKVDGDSFAAIIDASPPRAAANDVRQNARAA